MSEDTSIEQENTEKIIAPEIPRNGWETLIVLQRHGRYDSRRPKDGINLSEEEKAYGHLTEEGKLEAKKRADERIEAALSQDHQNTDFLIVNSPTYWLDNEQLGQRAKATAEIIAGEIIDTLQERSLSGEQFLNHSDRFRGKLSRPDPRIGEALMFQVPEFANFLRKEYGGQGPDFWANYNRDTHRETREQLGAEGPAEIADRISQSVNVVARFARGYHHQHPDRKLVVWMVTHGDGLEPYLQRALHVPEEAFTAGYNEGIGIAIDPEGNAKTKIKGVDYQVPLATHGKPASVQSNQ